MMLDWDELGSSELNVLCHALFHVVWEMCSRMRLTNSGTVRE